MERTISISIPEDVFQKLQLAAQTTQRSVDEVIVNTVNANLTAPPDLPSPLAQELAVMHNLKDDELWACLQPTITVEQQQRLEALARIPEQRTLSSAERTEQQTLLESHHRAVLRRAQALAILTLRGYVVSDEQLAQTVV